MLPVGLIEKGEIGIELPIPYGNLLTSLPHYIAIAMVDDAPFIKHAVS
jgi:hypothetical protein